MEVAIIGGGVAGLVSARHFSEPGSGFKLTLFEQTDSLGGTWVYTDQTGKDSFNLPIHSSMYKHLRTNLPKETMMFPDFPHHQHTPSYVTSKEVLQYLKDYVDHFNIKPFVKFRHSVKMITPIGKQWKVTVEDLLAKKEVDYKFDAVIICNGHNSVPKYPQIPGIHHFKGGLKHSHDYRDPECYRNKKVLIIGAGPSGLDITFDISKVTQNIYLSHHTEYANKVGFPKHVTLKPDVERILEDGRVLFKDGTSIEVNYILYCTGYLYTYPFLSKECGLTVEDNCVSPLYKSIININHPTMAFIGVVRHCPIFYLVDIQVRFFLQTLKHPNGLPSREEMMLDLEEEIQVKSSNGITKSNFHVVGENNSTYLNQLAELGGFESIPPIILKIYFHGYEKIFSDFKNFRNNYYRIIDENNFSVVDIREIQQKHIDKIPSDVNCITSHLS